MAKVHVPQVVHVQVLFWRGEVRVCLHGTPWKQMESYNKT